MHVTTDWRMTPQGVDDIVNFELEAEGNNFGVQRKGVLTHTWYGDGVSCVCSCSLMIACDGEC